MSKGRQEAAFLTKEALFELVGEGEVAKEAIVTKERTDWKTCLGRRKYLWPSLSSSFSERGGIFWPMKKESEWQIRCFGNSSMSWEAEMGRS